MSYQPYQSTPFQADPYAQGPNQAYPAGFPPTQQPPPFYNQPPPQYQNPRYGTGAQHQGTFAPAQQSSARPWFRITKEDVRNPSNDQVIATISTGSSIGLPSVLSSKSCVTLSRPDGVVLGTMQFHEVTTSAIDFSVHNRQSKLKNDGFISDKWCWQPMFRGPMAGGDRWYWKMKSGSSGTLEDQRKDGYVIARVEDGSLTVEQNLSPAEFDEVLVTAVAVSEKARRQKKDKDAAHGVEGILEAVLAG